MTRLASVGFLALALVAGACTSDPGDGAQRDSTGLVPALEAGELIDYGTAPAFEPGPIDPELEDLIDRLGSSFSLGLSAVTIGFRPEQLDRIVELGDPRALWLFTDLLSFPIEGWVGPDEIVAAFEELSGTNIGDTNPRREAANRMIAWDLPAPDGYLGFKRALFATVEPQWEPLFTDEAEIDWRHVSWGGVLIDDRQIGDGRPCSRGCIPALDDPAVSDADGGDWYPDDRTVFGVVVNGEARAYPKNIMEVHEMVNDTLGGRRIALPYCTLCGSAQAYLTDEVPTGVIPDDALPILRTSGLLIRSNKMMYEYNTLSFVDTFLGRATSGPLQVAGIEFNQVSVVASTWGEWKRAHPETTIVAEDGGVGRRYPLDPLRGRDDDGPIFPIGNVDPRLPVQELVLGVRTGDGSAVAVHVAIARATLLSGSPIQFDGVTIELDGDGIRAVDADGSDLGSHQAFWFAWSQFVPETLVWPSDF